MIGSDHNQSKSVTDSSEREPERVPAMAAVAQIPQICVKSQMQRCDRHYQTSKNHHYQQKTSGASQKRRRR